MNYRLLVPFLLFLLILQAAAQVENTDAGALNQSTGIVRVPSIDLTIDASGIVSIKEDIIVRRGEFVEVLLPSNVQNLQVTDSEQQKIDFEKNPYGNFQLVSFTIPKNNTATTSQENIYVLYETQELTSKSGNLWNINYNVQVTPIGTPVPGTVIRLFTPKNTQILNLDFKDFYWSPMGDSEIEIYPLTSDFTLSFSYKLGASGGIVFPNVTTTTTLSNTTSTTLEPSAINYLISQINNIYYILVFGIILAFMLGLFSVYLRHKRAKEALKINGAAKEKETPTEQPETTSSDDASGVGGSYSVETVNHSFEVIEPSSEAQKGAEKQEVTEKEPAPTNQNGLDDKEELVDAPNKPLKPRKGVREVKDSIRNVLDETELKVVDMLLKYEDEITQAYIYKTTGIPKSSLSDTIKRLEKRNVIERKREGRINWIKLKDWVFD